MTNEEELEEVEGPTHECKGKPTTYLSEPLFTRVFAEGEPYMGQHLFYEIRCIKCDFILDTVTHTGRCHSGQELELLGSHWNSKHQQFVFPKGETPSWRCWHLSYEQRLEISSYYRGWLDQAPKITIQKNTSF